MAKGRRKTAGVPEEDSEDWLVTYADAITLLMAFFVMLVSFSKIDLPMFEEVQAGIEEKIGGTIDNDTPIFSLEAQMNNILSEASEFPPDAVNVGFDDEGLVIDFASGYFFEQGTTKLTPGALKILAAVRRELEDPPYDVFLVDVEGHTSDLAPGNAAYPSNWELSAAQAARVVRAFIELGMEPQWLNASGYADTQPVVPNRDLAGAPIVQNQRQNERISLRLHP